MVSQEARRSPLQRRRSSKDSPSRERAPSSADHICIDPSRVLMQADAARDGKRRRRPGRDDDSRASKKRAVGRVPSPVAHLSCSRIRPFAHAARPKAKEETRVVCDDAQDVITEQNTSDSSYRNKIEPAMAAACPKKETSSSTHVRHGGIAKEKAGEKTSCTRFRPAVAVQASGIKDKLKGAGVVRDAAHGVIKTKQEAVERVQPTVMKSIRRPSHPASVMKVRSAGVLRNGGVIKTKQETSRSVKATVTKSIPQIRPPAPALNHQDPFAPQDAVRAALAVARQARERRQQNVYRKEREEARRELDKVVRTVFFNDPYITLENALKL